MAKKETLFGIITFLFVTFIILVLMEGYAQYSNYKMTKNTSIDKGLYGFHKELGWQLNDGSYRQKHVDFEAVYNVKNRQRVTTYIPEHPSVTVNVYGDSFGFGTGMNDEYTIQSLLAKNLGNAKVNNYGLSGYGPLQYKMSYDRTAHEGDINVFLIFTGNDFRDIQRGSIEWGPEKPVLIKDGVSYKIKLPTGNKFVNKGEQEQKYKFRLQLPSQIKFLMKSIPFIVKLRSRFVKPDKGFVDESIKRFDFLFSKTDKGKNLFVILPSISIIKKISLKTDEGYFLDSLDKYLSNNNFLYINMAKENILTSDDFWPREGHNNISGNRKIAEKISILIKSKFY